jgi:GNAT superfamily N-acetyltransferase
MHRLRDKVDVSIEPLDPERADLIDLVARRMRRTLIEVLGARIGARMYDLDWLRERVRFHLDTRVRRATVLLAYDAGRQILGHTIARIEKDEHGANLGLFSTTYVARPYRRAGVGESLVSAGEEWLRCHGAQHFATDTDENNVPLIRLFEKRGYAVTFHDPATRMIRLGKAVSPSHVEASTGAATRSLDR